MNSIRLLLAGFLAATCPLQAAWTVTDGPGQGLPGRAVDVRQADHLIARLIYGPGQMKPYLHVYGPDGVCLTNPGLDSSGKQAGQYPHHRGLFIGWKIDSDLGLFDLWHMTGKTRMEVVELEELKGDAGRAVLRARVEWRAGDNMDLLLTETREFIFSRPEKDVTQIDTRFVLTPARDLRLAGDLQHSGVHFRAAAEVAGRAKETSYLHDPPNVAKGADLRWCRLLFPVEDKWYSCQQMNSPSNPVEELSTRAYGRFGYFFRKRLASGQPLALRYRFVVEPVAALSEPGRESELEAAASRTRCEARYRAFLDGP